MRMVGTLQVHVLGGTEETAAQALKPTVVVAQGYMFLGGLG